MILNHLYVLCIFHPLLSSTPFLVQQIVFRTFFFVFVMDLETLHQKMFHD